MKFLAFLVSVIVGYIFGHILLQGAAAAYASILISYHLYLVFFIVNAERKTGLSMPVGPTILTHSAFLAFLIGLAYMRARVPFFGFISLLVPALAPFEANWLFGGDRAPATTSAVAPVPVADPTMEDHDAFREHLRQEHRPFRKPGRSVDEEFSFWLADRAQKKAEAAAVGNPGTASRQ